MTRKIDTQPARFNRRHFIAGLAAVAGVGAIGGIWATRGSRLRGTLFSAFENARGDQFVGGVQLASGDIFGAPVPLRAHGCAVHPRDRDRVVFFARRPGTQAFNFQHSTLRVHKIFETPAGRHLAGHGIFSADGDYLFTPEHDYERVRGIVAVRDTRDYSIVAEIDTRGIDPHEVAWLPGQKHLLVANGGIMTHPRSFRRKLNIPTMDPSLCVIDADSGTCLEQWRLPDHQLSIRHLSVAGDGRAAVALQYEGDIAAAPSVAALYYPASANHPRKGLIMLDAPLPSRMSFRAYAASVSLSASADVIAVACPYGNGVACWSFSEARYLGFVGGIEPYGVATLADGKIVMSQRDGEGFVFAQARRTRQIALHAQGPLRWDDHWVAVDS